MKYFISLLLLVTFISCNNDNEPTVYQTEDDIIQYLTENDLNATKNDAGIFYNITSAGNDKYADENATITFSYKLYLIDGTIVEISDEEGIEVVLSQILPGLANGLTYFSEGSEGTIYIPPAFGYGFVDRNDVPAGSVLIFDVKILKITTFEDQILAYLSENNLVAQKSETGLYYIVEVAGEGAEITQNSTVTVAYKGYLLNGTEFDSSSELGVKFNLSNLIPGFKEGVTYFKEGGKGKLLLPPDLAYGSNGSGSIPPNAVIIFDIEVKTLHD